MNGKEWEKNGASAHNPLKEIEMNSIPSQKDKPTHYGMFKTLVYILMNRLRQVSFYLLITISLACNYS